MTPQQIAQLLMGSTGNGSTSMGAAQMPQAMPNMIGSGAPQGVSNLLQQLMGGMQTKPQQMGGQISAMPTRGGMPPMQTNQGFTPRGYMPLSMAAGMTLK